MVVGDRSPLCWWIVGCKIAFGNVSRVPWCTAVVRYVQSTFAAAIVDPTKHFSVAPFILQAGLLVCQWSGCEVARSIKVRFGALVFAVWFTQPPPSSGEAGRGQLNNLRFRKILFIISTG